MGVSAAAAVLSLRPATSRAPAAVVASSPSDAAASPAVAVAPAAPLTVSFGELTFEHETFSASVLPGETVPVRVGAAADGEAIQVVADAGTVTRVGTHAWSWTAPAASGMATLQIVDPARSEPVRLHVFVLVPFGQVKNGVLNGYRIGSYPAARTIQGARYAAPRGFIEVTAKNRVTLVSPHFKLEQFLCKQESGYPKYLVLDPRLLLRLEVILDGVNRRGHAAQTLQVMSGYRTPWYNRAIGNTTNSRHSYGDAADVYVDVAPPDGNMDDLSADGRVNDDDARELMCLVEHLSGIEPGGLGGYSTTSNHGPYVHTDARGAAAHWGLRAACEDEGSQVTAR